MIRPGARLQLARKVRLRQDPLSGKQMLLSPERGLELSDTAAQIARLCAARPRTPAEIVAELAGRYPAESRARLEGEVAAFLDALDRRGLLRRLGDDDDRGGDDGAGGGPGGAGTA